MNIRSELRVAWFVDSCLSSYEGPISILDAGGTGRKRQTAQSRVTSTRLSSLRPSDGTKTPVYWNLVQEGSYDAVVGGHPFAQKELIGVLVYEMARAVKPGGFICLVVSQPARLPAPAQPAGEYAIDEEVLLSLAYRNHLVPVHASMNLAPVGASPAWYGDGENDLLLVAQKPLEWIDTPSAEMRENVCLEKAAFCEGFVPKNMQPWAKTTTAPKKRMPTGPAGRINYLVQKYQAQTYLELNVHQKKTFSLVAAPVKVMACPLAQQAEGKAQAENATVLPLAPDAFFQQLATPGSAVRAALEKQVPSLLFDIIFINGEHSFAVSLRDFTNSLAYAHENTVFVLNATVPNSPYSALPDKKRALAYSRAAGLAGAAWHGDVFKTVFAIHDLFPQYSYCTLAEESTQTFIWRADDTRKRAPLFGSLERIAALDYFGMLEHAAALMPVAPDLLPKLIGKSLVPYEYARPGTWKKLFYSPPAAMK